MKSSSTRPAAKSGTKSSASATSKKKPAASKAAASSSTKNAVAAKAAPSKAAPSASDGPDTLVQWVKGVGPRLATVFNTRGISTVRDLLTFFPRSYEDRSRMANVASVQDDQNATLALTVLDSRTIRTRTGKTMFEVRARDESGLLTLKWFYAPRGIEGRFKPGARFVATGKIKAYLGRPEMIHPEISFTPSASAPARPAVLPLGMRPVKPAEPPIAAAAATEGADGTPDYGRVVPVYTEIDGIPTRTLRKVLWEAIQKYLPTVTEDLPHECLHKHGLPPLSEAIRAIHFPDTPEGESEAARKAIQALLEFRTPAHTRLIYEEFFKFEWLVLRQRLRMERQAAVAVGRDGGRKASEDLAALLPFALTNDQKKAIGEIHDEMSAPHPMNRLVQGDVGSGKTAVSFLAAAAVLAEGGQAVLMAPTEILAEQHYRNAVKLFGGRLNSVLLTGKTTAAERAKLLPRLASGEPLLAIGTHALLEDAVVFRALNLVMIDEQQRFGVEQRRILRHKGLRPSESGASRNVIPHMLVLSATPIPRTLALTAYGDLSVSTIKEKPPGRSAIISKVIKGDAREKAYEKIREELRAGRQAYFIYPLVNESEAEGFTHLKSAVQEADLLQHEVFPDFKVALLHGQMKPDEKASVMDAFKRGETHVLVSTTVIEVGVDVPNSTVMAVEHSERFGLSQLHQLRGRVGRGAHQSYCFFFAAARSGQVTEARLEVLEQTEDGFEIAEADLRIRGPGDFLGTRQAGTLPFRLADLVRDREWLLKARDDAADLLKSDPELALPGNQALRRYFEREGKLQSDRLKTS